MATSQSTRDRLLRKARRLIWSRGYANVSLRQIARAAGVDVALVSRYFGGKRGLFEATLEHAFEGPALFAADSGQLVDRVVEMFVNAPRQTEDPSVVRMLLMNAHDEEVGPFVRDRVQDTLQSRLEEIIGDRDRAALFMAALLGMSVAEKSLHLGGIAKPDSPRYQAQLRHMLEAALTFDG